MRVEGKRQTKRTQHIERVVVLNMFDVAVGLVGVK